MRDFFRCDFRQTAFTPMLKITAGILLGALLGAGVFSCIPAALLSGMVVDITARDFSLNCGLLCAIFPLALALVLRIFCGQTCSLIAVPAFSCFLLTFSAFAFALQGIALLVWVMLLGRSLSLSFLFWFILQPDHKDRRILVSDFFLAAALTVATMLLINWLTIPAVGVFGVMG